MTKRNRDLPQRATGGSTALSGQLASPQLPAAAKWKMAIATFVGAYIVTAIAIPRELSWLPHSWSFYEINIITNIIMATAMTWGILPGMSRLLRRWLYVSHDGTPVPVTARRPGRASLTTTRRPGMVTVHVAPAGAQTASRNKWPPGGSGEVITGLGSPDMTKRTRGPARPGDPWRHPGSGASGFPGRRLGSTRRPL